jgi:hypothetical protein
MKQPMGHEYLETIGCNCSEAQFPLCLHFTRWLRERKLDLMESICVNYITHAECGEENKQLVLDVFRQLQYRKLVGVKYAAFKMGENIFVHLAQFESEEGREAFHALPAFQAFEKNIALRLASEPIVTPLMEIDTISTLNMLPKDGSTQRKNPLHLLVNYSVQKESIALIKNAIADTFSELKQVPVDNLFYAVYQVGLNSFIHLQCFPCDAASKYIFSLSSFQEFFELLETSFKNEPMALDVEKIGYYNTLT